MKKMGEMSEYVIFPPDILRIQTSGQHIVNKNKIGTLKQQYSAEVANFKKSMHI